MDWFMKLKDLDRRVIYLLIFLGVLIPLVKPIGFPRRHYTRDNKSLRFRRNTSSRRYRHTLLRL